MQKATGLAAVEERNNDDNDGKVEFRDSRVVFYKCAIDEVLLRATLLIIANVSAQIFNEMHGTTASGIERFTTTAPCNQTLENIGVHMALMKTHTLTQQKLMSS